LYNGLYRLYNGLELIGSEYMVDRVRARRNKKKRIDKKWLKRYGYISKPKKEVYIVDRKIYGHPDIIKLIIESCK
jgi:hypothetical protein